MPTDAQISLIVGAVNHIVDKDDPESQTFLQKMMKVVHDLEISMKSSSPTASSSGAKHTKEENRAAADAVMANPAADPAADAVMADANSPKIDDANRVSLSESDNDIDADK